MKLNDFQVNDSFCDFYFHCFVCVCVPGAVLMPIDLETVCAFMELTVQ